MRLCLAIGAIASRPQRPFGVALAWQRRRRAQSSTRASGPKLFAWRQDACTSNGCPERCGVASALLVWLSAPQVSTRVGHDVTSGSLRETKTIIGALQACVSINREHYPESLALQAAHCPKRAVRISPAARVALARQKPSWSWTLCQ